MRFDLIDRVIEQDAQRLVAVKNVTSAEEYLGDHFPGFPVLPGVMMLETLVQAARHLVAETFNGEPLVATDIRNVRYGSFVQPGQTLTVEVTIHKEEDDGITFKGVGRVEDKVAVQGRFRLTPLTAAEPTT
ncbi:MAG: polyketide synthase dehydratase domain-containing protein [Phycisphaeraceae bacterium]|nr:polyketide synthase dehydratase domain-containing protein [Phycisphaeraceae bacterium]